MLVRPIGSSTLNQVTPSFGQLSGTQHPWFNTSLTWFPVTVNQRLVHLRFFFRTLQAEMDRVREKLLS